MTSQRFIQVIEAQVRGSIATKQALLAHACLNALKSGGKIIFAGNGGSFAAGQHLSAEFTSRFLFDRAPLASVALCTNNSAISPIGNDYGYAYVFSRELEGIAKPGDIFIAISTSGNSENIVTAVGKALDLGAATWAWTGHTGGKLKVLCPCLCVPSSETARIQESHILIGHIIGGLVEADFFGKATAT